MSFSDLSSIEKAYILVDHAKLSAIASIQSYEEQHLEFRKLTSRGFDEIWIKLFIVGCVGVALAQVEHDLPPADRKEVFRISGGALERLTADAKILLPNFMSTLIRGTEKKAEGIDAVIGRWFWEQALELRQSGRILTKYSQTVSVQSEIGYLIMSAGWGYWRNDE